MNAVNWFEIPATDFDRGVKFYEALLGITLKREMFGGTDPNGVFPYDADAGVGGAVVHVPYAKPGADGVIIYIHAYSTAVLEGALARVESLGGSVVMPKMSIGPNGYVAAIIDSEGNRVGLHIPTGV
jgi:uncharacterized protein